MNVERGIKNFFIETLRKREIFKNFFNEYQLAYENYSLVENDFLYELLTELKSHYIIRLYQYDIELKVYLLNQVFNISSLNDVDKFRKYFLKENLLSEDISFLFMIEIDNNKLIAVSDYIEDKTIIAFKKELSKNLKCLTDGEYFLKISSFNNI